MRFSAAAAAVMAGSAVNAAAGDAVSTDYTTQLITITACDATVTDCPARSTQVSTTVLPLTTETLYKTRVHTITSCAPEVTDCPAHSVQLSTETFGYTSTVVPVTTTPAGVAPVGTPTAPAGVPSAPAGSAPAGSAPAGSAPAGTPASDVPGTQVAPPATQAPPPATSAPACPGYAVTAVTKSYTTVLTSVEYHTVEVPCATATNPPAQGTGYGPVPTTPSGNSTTPGVPVPTAGAATLAGSAIFAAIAGVAAFILA
ncbi:hypothetical protein E4U21_004519 [Claviceps maximensis]|nr:hypothetical protein E4U21_004519 [Claviceps maximensis]